MKKVRLLFFSNLLLLVACESQKVISPEETNQTPAKIETLSIRPASEPVLVIPSQPSQQERFIAETLFEGLQALDQDKLLTPVEDNAYARFQRVLAIDPSNEIALEGIEQVLLRYIELSAEASRRGQFSDAASFLERAAFVNEDHSALAEAKVLLESEINSEDLIFNLDSEDFMNRTEAAVAKLEEIAEQAREHNAFFLIIAPNDSLARWMYLQMRNAVTGFRLRGNIELANQTSVRLRVPAEK